MILGLLSDAHGNVEGFREGVRLLRRLGAERILFLGDAVGYLPGAGVVEAIVDEGVEAIAGNHEAMLLDPTFPGDDAVFGHRATRRALGAAGMAVVASWPTRRVVDTVAGPLLLVHDAPGGHGGRVYPDTDLGIFGSLPWAWVAVGHTHRAFVGTHGATGFLNVGSCGLPRDDGRWGAVAVVCTDTARVRIVRFDLRDCTRRALARVGPVPPLVYRSVARREPLPPTARSTVGGALPGAVADLEVR